MDVDARPLNARSLALSALLGTHPPRLPAHGLVALAEVFDITPGAMRTALSRLVAGGDVVNESGIYALTDRLVERQAAQDAGRHAPHAAWDGRWHAAVASVDQRRLADRRRVRTVFENARFGELRPDTWLRPANLPAPRLGADWIVTTGEISGTAPDELAGRLWDLDRLAAEAQRLGHDLERIGDDLERNDPGVIRPAFESAAQVVRFLRGEPLLPKDLVPADWPVPTLRERYDALETRLQARLRPFLLGEA